MNASNKIFFRNHFSSCIEEEEIGRIKLILDSRVRIKHNKQVAHYINYGEAQNMPSSKVGLEFLHHISIPNEIIELSQKVAEVSQKVRS